MRRKKPFEHPKEIESFNRYLLIRPKTSKNTRRSYEKAVDQLLTIADKEPANLTRNDIEKWQLWCRKHYCKNTLSLLYAAINVYIRFLVEKKHNKNFVTADGRIFKLQIQKVKSPRANPLTKEEMKSLFDSSKGNIRDHALLKTLYYAVPRISELVNMDVEHINQDRSTIKMLDVKNDEIKEISINPHCLQAIQEYILIRNPRDPEEKALFLNPFGRRIGTADIRNTIKRYAVKCGIKKRVYPHLFRHTGITHLAEAGWNEFQIRSLSRHESLDILKDYVNLANEERQRVADSLSNGIEDDAPEQPKPPVKPVKREESTTNKEKPKNDVAYNKNSSKEEFLQLLIDNLITPQEYRQLLNKGTNINGYQ